MRMPTDGSTFNEIEGKWPHFKEDPHNLKLLLIAYGVNLFGDMRSTHSV